MSELLYGRRAVLETLQANRRPFYRLWLEAGSQENPTGTLAAIQAAAQARSLPVRSIQGGPFDRLQQQDASHQGVALEVGDYPYCELDEVLAMAQERQEPPLLLLLDHVQDPHNLGALARTALAMGVHGIVIPDRRSAPVTAAVSNVSAGAVEHIRVARVGNLNRTIDWLKQAGVWVMGLDVSPEATPLERANLDGPLAVVVGSEGKGLNRLTREKCDFTVWLPMQGPVESLNAAVAGSIVLYMVRQARQRPTVGAV